MEEAPVEITTYTPGNLPFILEALRTKKAVTKEIEQTGVRHPGGVRTYTNDFGRFDLYFDQTY